MKKIGRLHNCWYLPYIFHNGGIGQIRTNTKGKTWGFPEDVQLVESEAEQILMRNIHVTYMQSVRIKCKVENDLNISKLDNATEQLKK